MEIPQTVLCPCCGEINDILVDSSQGNARWITDCQVCCRPMEVAVECAPGEVYSIQAEPA